MISLIVAYAKNRVIGKDNDIPWYIPGEQKMFKEITMGHPLIMGRNTYESIYNRRKAPLPGRRNIVVSQSLKSIPEGFELADSLETAVDMAGRGEVFVIGGERLFKETIEAGLANKVYASEIEQSVDGDRYFPDLPDGQFTVTKRKQFDGYTLVIYERV